MVRLGMRGNYPPAGGYERRSDPWKLRKRSYHLNRNRPDMFSAAVKKTRLLRGGREAGGDLFGGDTAGVGVGGQEVVEVVRVVVGDGGESLLDHAGDIEVADAVGHEGLNRDLVGRVKGTGGDPPGQGGLAGQAQAGEQFLVGRAELEVEQLGKVEGGVHPLGPLGVEEGVLDGESHDRRA